MSRVLLVDDCPDVTTSLALLLRYWHHEVHVANDGLAALELASRRGFDVVLLDVTMPGMHGCEVARRLRDLPAMREALLVSMTGLVEDEFRRLPGSSYFDLHLVKPVCPEDLHDLLANCAEHTRFASCMGR